MPIDIQTDTICMTYCQATTVKCTAFFIFSFMPFPSPLSTQLSVFGVSVQLLEAGYDGQIKGRKLFRLHLL